MWTSFAEEQGGVLLCGVEVWGLDNPVEKLLAICGRAPARLGGAGGQLGEYVVVLGGDAVAVIDGIAVHMYQVEVCGVEKVVTLHKEGSSGGLLSHRPRGGFGCLDGCIILLRSGCRRDELEGTPVGLEVGELGDLALEVGAIEVDGGVPHTYKINGAAVFGPAEVIDIRVEGFCDIDFGRFCGFVVQLAEVIDAEALAVGFVAVTFHGEPRDVAAVG